jgi:excisionase family DNA binding protein
MDTHPPPNAAPPDTPRLTLLTKVQLARELQISVRHLERLVAARKLPVVKLSRGCVRFSRERVLAAIWRFEQAAISTR